MATSAGRAAARLLVGDAECPPFVGMTTKVYEASSEDGNRDRLCMGGSACTMQLLVSQVWGDRLCQTKGSRVRCHPVFLFQGTLELN